MKNPSRILKLASCILLAGTVLSLATLHLSSIAVAAQEDAQTADPAAPQAATSNLQPSTTLAVDPGVFQPFVDGLLGKYGWLTTVLLAIGSLRILFKPVMLVVENTVKNDPAKFAAIQKFEAGPIYKTIATVLDVGASIKLPLVKPPGPPAA